MNENSFIYEFNNNSAIIWQLRYVVEQTNETEKKCSFTQALKSLAQIQFCC